MVKPCAVPRCKTGKTKVSEKCSVFKVPSNIELYNKWKAIIPNIVDLKQTQYVCEKHFEDRYILRKWMKRDSNGQIIAEAKYVRPRLDPLAVPSIFYSNSAEQPCVSQNVAVNYLVEESSTEEPPLIEPTEGFSNKENCPMECDNNKLHEPYCVPQSAHTELQEEVTAEERPVPQMCLRTLSISGAVMSGTTERSTKFSIPIPSPWSVSNLTTAKGDIFVFSYIVMKEENGIKVPVMEKSITINHDHTLRFCVYGRVVDTKELNFSQTFDNLVFLECLERYKNTAVCLGLGAVNINYVSCQNIFEDYVGRWRHKDCTLVYNRKRCSSCMKMRDLIRKSEARSTGQNTLSRIYRASNPIDQRKLIALRKKNLRERREKIRARHRVLLLKQSLEDKRHEMSSIRDKTLNERCANLEITPTQKALLEEIISAAGKKDPRTRRYGEEWLMLCLLMNIRSPSYYGFLRKNNVLPLPCTRTIRNYFSLISMKCGFDESFAALLKKHFESKSPLQRHGILLIDEINLRKSVAVCAKNLTYVGLTDLGDGEQQSTNIEDQATHGLVIMFQPLADSYTQPIAVFASKNSVKGDELAKIMIKAIAYVENCGVKIHGIVGDGASTNARMWSIFGVSGSIENTKTHFTHPLDDQRKVFVFSDIPHLIKTIRNRLYNKKKLRINSSGNYICWEFFNILFQLDSQHPANARVCSKLTQRHVVLDNTSKMRVRLATQIFSNSVANGLTFYASRTKDSLTGCEETVRFCKFINDMFDACNRKTPNEGLTPQSKDFKILQDSLRWLNEWEKAVQNGHIKLEEFLTSETSKGLRISLQSTMDMCCYLIDKFEFKYLLSGKINQDNLEKFFGTIRQAAGCNDHPNSPTFLQLYKLLSVYSIIKPPKYGNCTVSDEPSPQILVSLQELKEVYGQMAGSKFSKCREEMTAKLEKLVRHDNWDSDVSTTTCREHDYALPSTLDCIIYYVTGYLCKQILKIYGECGTCVHAVRSESSATSIMSQLVDIKSRGGLIHANLKFFQLIRHVEECFAKYAAQSNVFDCTINEVLSSYPLTFPCTKHASSILSYAIIYYIRLRMRQHVQQENKKLKQKFVIQKKLSKLANQ